jgi:hypothetical protein
MEKNSPSRQFYATLQNIQDSPSRGIGRLSRDEIDVVSKLQKKEDASMRAFIQGMEINEPFAGANGPDGTHCIPRRPT